MSDSLHFNPYGVGLAYRFNVHHEAVQHRSEIDLLEISTEDYIVRERRTYSDPDERLLRDALEKFPCVAHGLSLSIGTVGALNQTYLDSTNRFMAENGLNVFSEHLAFHSVDGNDLTMFLAIPFEEVAVQWVKQNYYAIRRKLGRPFALENVTYSFPAPHSSLSEADFLRRICEETDCTLLLDVTNVFNNAKNHNYDPFEFFDRIPMHRVSQMHLAGGFQRSDGRWEDSHSEPVMDEVWPLFDEAVKRAVNLRNVILERDSKLKPFDSVMADIRKAREIFYTHRPTLAPAVEEIAFDDLGAEAPDPLAHEFAGLRSYQRTLMGRIANPAFRAEFLANAPEAVKRFELTDPEWFQKIVDCDGGLVHEFEEAWDYFQKEDREVAEEYEKREWAAWANQLGGW
ncbi:DUF692 domain-containing protein [Verrucomicrobiales bacterium BCK34]|nr:DUF692 domain-containing protein [Verrucomicrobiales bacterium BCK34]